MKTLYIERSTGESRSGDWVQKLDLEGVTRIVVGTGPGSFAGIRSALAFAQGYAMGTDTASGGAAPSSACEVLGLPSACALAGDGKIAVVGDARQGKLWIALFDGFSLVKPIFQVNQPGLMGSVPGLMGSVPMDYVPGLMGSVPMDYTVATPDANRIDEMLRDTFGERYIGGQTPTSEGLKRFAEACPSILAPEPLPIYLNPAVRT